MQHWLPPGKNCGLCGADKCKNFIRMVQSGEKTNDNCPYFEKSRFEQSGSAPEKNNLSHLKEVIYPERDVLGNLYDFVLTPLPGEISARKIVLPFRSDLVEKLPITTGDYVMGRPMGAGCPIPHVLKVIEAETVTGLLYTWVVGPQYSREKEVKDVTAYHMVGFEGIAAHVRKPPVFGCRATFLPGFCMMALNHTGLVNMILEKSDGLHVRIEDIRILAGAN